MVIRVDLNRLIIRNLCGKIFNGPHRLTSRNEKPVAMTDILPIQFGKYLLLEKIAVGGMAELYRARITGTQGFEKLVAIKKLLHHLTDETDLVNAFINEAKLAAMLQHQNIAHIFDFGSMEGTYFIAMEYLSGKDLRLIMDKTEEGGRPFPLEHALYISSRICEGLEYAYNMKDFEGNPLNIIHRDISPQNILITYDGEVKIVDFGIAKAAGKKTKTREGVIKGKVAYMSPEQASGKAIDRRSDIFSAGILLYEMLSGRQMFEGDAMETLALVQEAKFEPPENLGQALPPGLLKILHRALAKNPEDRYQSSGEMLTALEECIYQNALRPTARGLAQYMKALFHEDIATEERFMRDSMQIRIRQDPEGEIEVQEARKPVEKTLELSPSEILGKPRKKRPWILALTGIGLVILGVLFASSFWEKDLFPNQKTAAIVGKEVPLSQPPEEPVSNSRSEIAPTMSQKTKDQAPFPKALVPSQARSKTGPEPADLKPENQPNRLEKVMAALEAKRFEEAAVLSEEALASEPALEGKISALYTQALIGQAVSLAEQDSEKARSLLLKAVNTDPQNVRAHFELASLYVREENYPNAIQTFKKVSEMDPQFTEAFFNLAYVYARVKDYPKAEEMYRRVVDMAPPYLDEALFNLAMVQSRLGKTKESVENLERTLLVNPANEMAKRYLLKLRGDQRVNK